MRTRFNRASKSESIHPSNRNTCFDLCFSLKVRNLLMAALSRNTITAQLNGNHQITSNLGTRHSLKYFNQLSAFRITYNANCTGTAHEQLREFNVTHLSVYWINRWKNTAWVQAHCTLTCFHIRVTMSHFISQFWCKVNWWLRLDLCWVRLKFRKIYRVGNCTVLYSTKLLLL